METDEERAVRLDEISKQRRSMEETQIYWDGHVPSLEQETTRARMRKFHQEIATIETPTCSTCMERFPGMRVNVIKSECLRCARDKHFPKLFSVENNMHPGVVPTQLQVRKSICNYIMYNCYNE